MANDFSGDPNCVALWRFEDGALTTDSIGGNTLTNNAGVVSNQVDFKEGAASADFEASSSQYFSRTDALLSVDFPLKNGDTNKKISICGWFQLESTGSVMPLFTKYDGALNQRSLFIAIGNDDKFRVVMGYNGGASAEVIYSAGSLVTGRFYHYGFTFQDSDKAWKLVVWDDTGSSKIINTSGTTTNNINIENAAVNIGALIDNNLPINFLDGEKDEVPVFKDILTTGEIDAIRSGTYAPGILIVNSASHVQTADSPSIVLILAILLVNDSSHVHTASSPTLQAIYELLVNDTSHAFTADSPLLVVYLAVLDAIHTMSADSPILSFIPAETLRMIFTGKVPGVNFTAAVPKVQLTGTVPGVEFE